MKICRVLICLLFVVFTGCEQPKRKSSSVSEKTIKEMLSESGRYQVIAGSSESRIDFILLDSKTGKTWNLTRVNDVEGKPFAWEPVVNPELMSEEEWGKFLSRIEPRTTPSAAISKAQKDAETH